MHHGLRATALVGWADPADLFAAHEAHAEHAFWLDSQDSGWSCLGLGTPTDTADVMRVPLGGVPDPNWPAGPFRGGWVGWFDYESGAAAAGAPTAHGGGARWLRADRFLTFDHATERVWAVAPADDTDFPARMQERIRTVRRRDPVPAATAATVSARHEPQEYAGLVERCRDAIAAGDAYQLCMTTRFTVPGKHRGSDVYLRLRDRLGTHHGGYIRSGDVTLASASPELFLSVGNGEVRTRPIKGTRPRGATPDEDRQLAKELVESVKERAENVMIVDLMRNDLSRVCAVGTVRVAGLWQVESYQAVHQLVSTVVGTLRTDLVVGDLIAAAFPAGSMTGAPKLSAMTILHDAEGGPRGVYAGAYGWIGDDGSADLAMTIRSVVVHRDHAYVGAGGGITWGSVAADEVAEVGIKARAPLAAIGGTLGDDWTVPAR